MKLLSIILIFFSLQIFAETKPYPVLYADVFTEEGKEIIHFNWRIDYHSYEKVIISNEAEEKIGEVYFPNTIFNIEGLNNEYLFITAVNKEGEKSEAVKVYLNKDYSNLYADKMEQIVVDKPFLWGQAKFVKSKSGDEFIANGVNYCRISHSDHDTFEPDVLLEDTLKYLVEKHKLDYSSISFGDTLRFYDSYRAESMLRMIKSKGFNLVRVFIKTGERGSSFTKVFGMSGVLETKGLSISYMNNIIDFLEMANKYGIYVMPTFAENEMMDNNYFKELFKGASGQEILFSEAGIKAKQHYIELFLKYLKEYKPELINTIFALTMQNEFAFHSYEAPFNQISGTYTFIDGSKYNMSNDDERRALANKAIQNYYSKMKKTVEKYAPGMLIGEGTFAMGAVGKTYENSKGIRAIKGNDDLRFPMTAVELMNTEIDFLDFHIYRWGKDGNGEDVFNHFVDNMKLSTSEGRKLMKSKPVLMGEFGSFKEDEATLDEGIKFVKELKQSALDYGFKGTCYWTFDTFEQSRLWNLMWNNGKMLEEL